MPVAGRKERNLRLRVNGITKTKVGEEGTPRAFSNVISMRDWDDIVSINFTVLTRWPVIDVSTLTITQLEAPGAEAGEPITVE